MLVALALRRRGRTTFTQHQRIGPLAGVGVTAHREAHGRPARHAAAGAVRPPQRFERRGRLRGRAAARRERLRPAAGARERRLRRRPQRHRAWHWRAVQAGDARHRAHLRRWVHQHVGAVLHAVKWTVAGRAAEVRCDA